MKTVSDNTLPMYQKFGDTLHINFNEEIKTVQDMQGNDRTVYEYTTAVTSVFSDRSQMVDTIIRSVYPLSAELAVMNSAQDKPDAYNVFQMFRLQAKQLADGWISTK